MPGITLGWKRQTCYFHGMFMELIPLSLCFFFFIWFLCLQKMSGKNTAQGRICAKSFGIPSWDHPLHWCRLINQQVFFSLRMTQLYQIVVLISPYSPLEFHELVKYLGKNKNTMSTSIILFLINCIFWKEERLELSQWVAFILIGNNKSQYLLSLYYLSEACIDFERK